MVGHLQVSNRARCQSAAGHSVDHREQPRRIQGRDRGERGRGGSGDHSGQPGVRVGGDGRQHRGNRREPSAGWFPARSFRRRTISTLTVIERYTVAVAGGANEARENRVTGKSDRSTSTSRRAKSPALATTFIDDFLHSERSPEFCVRNFSDSCPGKQEELSDIRDNRARFVNNPAASSMGTASLTFYDTGARSAVAGLCRRRRRPSPSCWRRAGSRRPTKPPAQSGVAVGTCQLTTVYENWQWRLCDSRFLRHPDLSSTQRSKDSNAGCEATEEPCVSP